MLKKTLRFLAMCAGVLAATLAAPASAETLMTVSRCTAALDAKSVFQPVLKLAFNGKTQVFRIGSDGLTRSIVFNSRAAIDWAISKHAVDAVAVKHEDCAADSSTAEEVKQIAPDAGTGGGETPNTGGTGGRGGAGGV